MTIFPRPIAAALLLFLGLLPAGCGGGPPPPQAGRSAPPVAAGTTAPFRFGELAIGSMRRGMQIGRYVWGIDCAPPYDDVYWTSGVNMRRGSTFEERFAEVMTSAGFDVVGRPGGPDSPDGNRSRARFTVQGDLRDVQLELCNRVNWLTGSSKGSSGTGSVKVEWTVYDARGGGLVHRLVTTGVTTQERGVPQGDTMLMEEAFAAAVEALAADAGFRNLLSGGTLPAPAAAPAAPMSPATSAGSGPIPLVPVAGVPVPGPASPSPAVGRLLLRTGSGSGRVAAARVAVGGSSGASHGFVIGETDVAGEVQAVLLAALPGSDPTVSVRPAQGVELTGWVIGRDTASGFALVKVPARLTALPVRTGSLHVSQPVRAVPGGRGKEIEGIIASLRSGESRGATLIQADLGSAALFTAVTEAGDPLLDGDGMLIGVAAAAGRPAATPAGLVEFLAIGPLLDRLGADPAGPNASSPPSKQDRMGRNTARTADRNRLDRGIPSDPWAEEGELDGDVLDGDRAPPT
ncbi:serine protease [Azospirillum humicireducens]|uniref:Serine protease n=1 Tax=Azospirillum humicireducens TaxID=1226968 RepID=A0A160JHS1_9PROT|nr:serine protease [Azospirillum humicireducens]ANC92596.1 serine protease [Azospirillum humicireducens]